MYCNILMRRLNNKIAHSEILSIIKLFYRFHIVICKYWFQIILFKIFAEIFFKGGEIYAIKNKLLDRNVPQVTLM